MNIANELLVKVLGPLSLRDRSNLIRAYPEVAHAAKISSLKTRLTSAELSMSGQELKEVLSPEGWELEVTIDCTEYLLSRTSLIINVVNIMTYLQVLLEGVQDPHNDLHLQ